MWVKTHSVTSHTSVALFVRKWYARQSNFDLSKANSEKSHRGMRWWYSSLVVVSLLLDEIGEEEPDQILSCSDKTYTRSIMTERRNACVRLSQYTVMWFWWKRLWLLPIIISTAGLIFRQNYQKCSVPVIQSELPMRGINLLSGQKRKYPVLHAQHICV